MSRNMERYPNRDALREAHDIYLNAMRPFIIGNALDVIEGVIEISDIARIITKNWPDSFKQLFENVDPYYEARSAAWQIVEGRNRASHPPWDLDPEFTRTHLFLIANLLEKINRPDAKYQVENIRDRFFSNNPAGQPEEVEQAAYKKRLETMSTQLAIAVAGKTTAEERLSDISNRLEAAEVGKSELEKRLRTMSERLKDVEKENSTYKKRIETIPDQLGAVKVEKALKAASNQLATLKRVNAQLEEHLETTSTRLEDVEAELTACKEDLARALRQLEGTKEEQAGYLSAEERLARALGKLESESQEEEKDKTPKPRVTFREKFAESTTEEERVEIAKQVAKLRLDADATRAMSWKNIREEVLLTSDEFHKIIRISDYYKEVMLHRLGSLIDEGWVYNGSLNILCGFDVPEEFIEKMESNKTKAKVAEAPSYRGDTAKSPKSPRKWRRPGAVAALRAPAEIREAEAKIAKILNSSEKARLERELRKAKRAVYGSAT